MKDAREAARQYWATMEREGPAPWISTTHGLYIAGFKKYGESAWCLALDQIKREEYAKL